MTSQPRGWAAWGPRCQLGDVLALAGAALLPASAHAAGCRADVRRTLEDHAKLTRIPLLGPSGPLQRGAPKLLNYWVLTLFVWSCS